MTESFAQVFDGTKVEIGDIIIVVTKFFIVDVTGIPRVGEKWFKNRGIEGDN